ncbi:MAG: thiamine diphosphokinase [Eubacteriaceae bacterium]|nr:thiamine diphosphokinase [Eubacteriaceae bacterium]
MIIFIFTGGHYGTPDFYKKMLDQAGERRVIAADKGAEMVARLGLKPDLLVGDFDSVDLRILKKMAGAGVPIQRHPVRKNQTDTELAIALAMKEKPQKVILFGATGTRMDHVLASIHSLYPLLEAGIPAALVDEYNTLSLLKGTRQLELPSGTTLSILAYTDTVRGVTLSGFEYPLKDVTLSHAGAGWTVSNVTTPPPQMITVQEGILLVDIVSE